MTNLNDRPRQIVEQPRAEDYGPSMTCQTISRWPLRPSDAGVLDAEFGLLDYKQFDGEVSNVIRSSARHGFAYRLGSQSHR